MRLGPAAFQGAMGALASTSQDFRLLPNAGDGATLHLVMWFILAETIMNNHFCLLLLIYYYIIFLCIVLFYFSLHKMENVHLNHG